MELREAARTGARMVPPSSAIEEVVGRVLMPDSNVSDTDFALCRMQGYCALGRSCRAVGMGE